jgi:hypothetical protein
VGQARSSEGDPEQAEPRADEVARALRAAVLGLILGLTLRVLARR